MVPVIFYFKFRLRMVDLGDGSGLRSQIDVRCRPSIFGTFFCGRGGGLR